MSCAGPPHCLDGPCVCSTAVGVTAVGVGIAFVVDLVSGSRARSYPCLRALFRRLVHSRFSSSVSSPCCGSQCHTWQVRCGGGYFCFTYCSLCCSGCQCVIGIIRLLLRTSFLRIPVSVVGSLFVLSCVHYSSSCFSSSCSSYCS